MNSDEKLPEKLALEYFTMILFALEFIHGKNIIHRDLKPSNIFVNLEKGGIKFLKIADFGISKIELTIKESSTSTTGHGTTLLYAAPELLSDPDYDPSSKIDIWAAGIILYEMLTCTHPFMKKTLQQTMMAIMHADTSPKELPDKISPNTKKMIEIILDKDPTKRPDALTLLQSEYLRPTAKELLFKIKSADQTIFRVILNKSPQVIQDLSLEQMKIFKIKLESLRLKIVNSIKSDIDIINSARQISPDYDI